MTISEVNSQHLTRFGALPSKPCESNFLHKNMGDEGDDEGPDDEDPDDEGPDDEDPDDEVHT